MRDLVPLYAAQGSVDPTAGYHGTAMNGTPDPVASVDLPPEWLSDFCRRWKIVEFGLFGSAARGELRPESDIDFLVTFESGAGVSLMDLVRAKRELEQRLGRRVDLVERAGLRNPYRREAILREVIPLYAA